MGKLIDETGNRYGRLLVLEFAGVNKYGKAIWLCKCDCSGEVIIGGCSLRNGDTQSCGCYSREQTSKANSLPKGKAACNRLMLNYKYNAKNRDYAWELTDDEFRKLTQQDCFYCDTPPSQIFNPKRCNGKFTYSGIDRIDNSLGYTLNNCVACCKHCNIAKNNRPMSEFEDWIRQIYKHLIKD